ncbi:MAG: DUF3800 domain-containing protein [Chloroflexi bacterium]|nr:MAG: DUF3800 domain-containing protein [Chloroflexota bacterium]
MYVTFVEQHANAMRTLYTFFAAALILAPMGVQPEVCFDFENLKEQIRGHMQELEQWRQMFDRMKKAMDLDKLLAELGIKEERRNTETEIKAITEVETELHNRAMAVRYAPMQDACDIVSESETARRLEVNVKESLKNLNLSYLRNIAKPRNDAEYAKSRKQIIARLATSEPMTPERFLGEGGSYNEQDTQLAYNTIDLIMREYAMPPAPPEATEDSPDSTKVQRADFYAYVARRQLIRNTFTALVADNQPSVEGEDGKKISKNEFIKRYVEKRFGSKEAEQWIARVTNTDPKRKQDPKKATPDTEVLRILTTMEAFHLYLDHERYKSERRREALLALIAQLDIERGQQK